MVTSRTTPTRLTIVEPDSTPTTSSEMSGNELKTAAIRRLLASGDEELANKIIKTVEADYSDASEHIEKEDKTNEKLTNDHDNKRMTEEHTVFNNNKKLAETDSKLNLIIGLVSLIVAVFVGFTGIIYSSLSQNTTTMQAIRDETVAKVSASNDKVVYELQGLRSDMQNFRSEINQKFEMQDIKTENKILKEKPVR